MTIFRIRRATVVLLAAAATVGGVLVSLPRFGRMTTSIPPPPEDPVPRVAVAFSAGGTHDRFGINCTQLEVPGARTEYKRLFYDPLGRGNRTVVDLNGYRFIFGDMYVYSHYMKDPKTKQKIRQTPIPDKTAWVSTIAYTADMATIEVTRTIEIVAGDSSRQPDTVRVQYHVKNTAKADCTVGLRTHLDTCIGTTNEVPFYVPPVGGDPVVDERTIFVDEEVPDFVFARELDDLSDRQNTHAVLGVRLRGIQAPVKVSLCPANRKWHIPQALPEDPGADIFWAKRNLQPGQSQTFGYTYGLGCVEVENPPANQDITLQFLRAAQFESFPVVAHLRRGAQNQKVTLKLPEGVKFAPGETAEKELDASGERNAVTWRVLARSTGRYRFQVLAPGVGVAHGTVEVR